MSFDEERLIQNIKIIQYLLGQLYGVHKQKDPLTPGEDIINYKGQKWTDDNRALFALYYLGCAASSFPQFVDGELYAETNNITAYYKINQNLHSHYLTPILSWKMPDTHWKT